MLDIASVLTSINAKVRSLTARDLGAGKALVTVTLEVRSSNDLHYIMSRILSVPSVTGVIRNGDKVIIDESRTDKS